MRTTEQRGVPSGTVVSVNISERKTVRKTPGESGRVVKDRGFEGDAHAGDWHRQVSLLAQESIDKMVAAGLDVGPGDFAENVTTTGIEVATLPVGTVVRIGDEVVMEISQIGKVCHTKCAIYHQAGDCVMPREGVFAVVHAAGEIKVGDEIVVTEYPATDADGAHANDDEADGGNGADESAAEEA